MAPPLHLCDEDDDGRHPQAQKCSAPAWLVALWLLSQQAHRLLLAGPWCGHEPRGAPSWWWKPPAHWSPIDCEAQCTSRTEGGSHRRQEDRSAARYDRRQGGEGVRISTMGALGCGHVCCYQPVLRTGEMCDVCNDWNPVCGGSWGMTGPALKSDPNSSARMEHSQCARALFASAAFEGQPDFHGNPPRRH